LRKYVVDQEYSKALDIWNEVKVSCPKYSEQIYLLGSQVLQYNVETASPENKEKQARELLKLYDLYDKNFPNNQNGNFEKRAMALYDNKAGTEEEIYSFLELAFENKNNVYQSTSNFPLFSILF